MTQEDKQLLLTDLCARLPYGIRARVLDSIDTYVLGVVKRSSLINNIIYTDVITNAGNYKIEDVKPYLRPMSSMIEEEKKEMHNLLSPEGTAIYENDGIALPINHCGEFVPYEFIHRIIQYLFENHFDFMGLIPKGLALKAHEGMYKVEEK